MPFSFRKLWAQLETPGLFLVICILAFGIQIPWLGYYLDDWIILNAYNLGGAERVFEYAFIGNRPLVFWLWWIGFKLCGSTPIYWQIWALFWRWLTIVILWLGWRALWPKASRQVTFAALLFAVYPLFKQQPSALTFSFHWICFFLYGLSIYLMVLSIQRPKHFYPLMLGAVLADFIQLYSQEFYVGIELFRPVIIWLAISSLVPSWKDRLKRTIYYWASYLVLIALYLPWRLVLMPTPGRDRNTPELLYGLVTTPLQAMVRLATLFAQDFAEMLVGVWYKTIEPALFTPSPFSNLVAWGLVIGAALILFLFFKWRQPAGIETAAGSPPERPWYKFAIPAGILAMIFGFAPGWATNRHIYDLTGMYNDRFGLAAMFGASLLIVGLLELLVQKERYRVVLLCLLVGLAVGQNFRTTTSYRWSWEKQLRFYWQLKWRAPEIQAPTALIGEGALIGYMGSWATTSAFVQMYAPRKDVHFMDYWYYDLGKVNIEQNVKNQEPISDVKNFMRYSAPAKNSLVFTFQPDEQQCLWVLTDSNKTNRYLTEGEQLALPLSNLERILPQTKRTLRSDIFGNEIARDWCYYFEKGDLARQFQDWGEVVRLWQEADQKQLHPRVGEEYAPFIEGYAHTGDFEQALALTRKAFFPDYFMRDTLCATWKRIGQAPGDTPARRQALQRAVDDFGCEANILP